MRRWFAACLLACNSAPTRELVAGPFVGMAGADGAPGAPGALRASPPLVSTDGVLSIAASGCADGAVLAVQGGVVRCGPQRPTVQSLHSDRGLDINLANGNAVISLRFGTGAGDVRRGDHQHVGETFSGSTPGATLTVENTTSDEGLADRYNIAIRAESNAGADLDLDRFRAAVIGYNTAAQGGIGVLGDATQGLSFGDGVAGEAGGDKSAGVYGEARGGANSAGVRGETASPNARAVYAHALPGGVGLRVQGASDFGPDGVLLPIVWVEAPFGPTSLASCPTDYLALTGGCSVSGTAIDHAELQNKTAPDCRVGGDRGVQHNVNSTAGWDAYCCVGGAVRAQVMCLRVP